MNQKVTVFLLVQWFDDRDYKQKELGSKPNLCIVVFSFTTEDFVNSKFFGELHVNS